jgi:hypothetical protein
MDFTAIRRVTTSTFAETKVNLSQVHPQTWNIIWQDDKPVALMAEHTYYNDCTPKSAYFLVFTADCSSGYKRRIEIIYNPDANTLAISSFINVNPHKYDQWNTILGERTQLFKVKQRQSPFCLGDTTKLSIVNQFDSAPNALHGEVPWRIVATRTTNDTILLENLMIPGSNTMMSPAKFRVVCDNSTYVKAVYDGPDYDWEFVVNSEKRQITSELKFKTKDWISLARYID